jgi:predicted HicB family RNase H-like nuclease
MSKQNKEGMLNVRLHSAQKEVVKGLAAQQKISTSAYIRQLIHSFALPTE